MDEVFDRVGGRFKISLTDSTMMWIVHCAMDKAHERAQSKEGVIERLTEISKFYELAVIQLEGCLRFVQEEADNSLESSDEEVLWDLTEIRDRLVGRLKELELAIAEKDREFTERIENELKFRKALEMKEGELDSLCAKLKLEPARMEGIEVEEFNLGNRIGVDELIPGNMVNANEEFSGLKHSVDQQVWNIRRKLEPECKFVDRRRNKSCDSLKIEQMGSEIDVLKETMDIAFGKMRSAMFFSDMEPVEQQWKSSIEKDAMGVLIKGFVEEIQENFKAEVRRREKQVSFGLSEHLSDLMKEIKCLNDDLEALCLSQSKHESMIPPKPKERSSSEVNNQGKPQNSALRFQKVEQQKQLAEESSEDDASSFVAKLIKNHESFIKRKNKDPNWPKRENVLGKGCSSSMREEDLSSSRRRIQDVILRMENLIDWNEKLGESFNNYECNGNEKSSFTKRSYNLDLTQQEESQNENLEVGHRKSNNISVSNSLNEGLQSEIRTLKEEKEDAFLQTLIMEKTYAAILEGYINESSIELCGYDLETLIREGMHDDLLTKMVNEWNEQMESGKIDVQIREEIYYIVFSETLKDFSSRLDSALVECLDARVEISRVEDYNLEGRVREEISKSFFGEICKEWEEKSYTENLVSEEIYRIAMKETPVDIANTTDHIVSIFKEGSLEGKQREEISELFFGELYKEWNGVIERSDTENLVRGEVYQIVFEETLKDIANTGNRLVSKLNEVKNPENCIFHFHCNESFQCVEHSIKEDVYMVFLGEMLKEWAKEIDAHNFECLIRKEIFLLTVVEAVKEEASTSYREAAAQDHLKISADFISADKSDRSQEAGEEESLVQKPDSLCNFIKVEEDLIKRKSFKTIDYNVHTYPIQKKYERLVDKLTISELFTEMGSTFTSVSSKVEKALEQLTVSKALLSELRSCLGVKVEDIESFDDWKASVHNMRPSWSQSKEIKEVEVTPSCSAFAPIMEFLKVFMDLKCTVEEKVEQNILRLEEAIHYLNLLAEVVARQRRKELLYRKAFISRCENLRMAETEVDLLGDQVEVLLDLLEKIYNALHHYSPVLEQYFEVSDILKMIRKELIGEVLATSNI